MTIWLIMLIKVHWTLKNDKIITLSGCFKVAVSGLRQPGKYWGCSLISKGVLVFYIKIIVAIIAPMNTKTVSNRTGSLVKVTVFTAGQFFINILNSKLI